ncbi:MAG: hypothetical protein ACOX52_04990 [Verrucomicrobiota bacterium]|jgi:hypothetical protein
MGKYSMKGSAAFDAGVDKALARIVERVRSTPFEDDLRAIVLMGGYGRGEGSPWVRDGEESAFNDYDCVVVARPGLASGRRSRLRSVLQALERDLTAELGITVDLYLHTPESLHRAEFSLMNLEMRYGHRVIWGEPTVLEEMPEYELARLPLVEGTRLLLNRGKLLLDLVRLLHDGAPEALAAPEVGEKAVKFLMKARLAMGDALLMALGRYDISYVEKRQRMHAALDSDLDCPARPSFEIERVAEEFLQAVEFKEWVDFSRYEVAAWPEQLRQLLPAYIQFFYSFESVRLRVGMRDRDQHLLALPDDEQDRAGFRGFARGFQQLGMQVFRPSMRWSRVHPRARLYGAMPLLLDETSDLRPVPGLLGLPPAAAQDRATVEERFYRLREAWA